MKEILKIIQNHWLMPQNIVWCGGWHLYEEACEQQQKNTHRRKHKEIVLSLLCFHLYFQKHDVKSDISGAKQATLEAGCQ